VERNLPGEIPKARLSTMTNVHGQVSEARSRLLTTATRIVYAEGIHSVGIDRIVAEPDPPSAPDSSGIIEAC
jgi:hypothetical protein